MMATATKNATRAGSETLAGAWTVLRFTLRRDRVRIAVWAAAIGVLLGWGASAMDSLYPTAAERAVQAELLRSPAAIMMSGPGYGTDLADYTFGAMVANEYSLTVIVAVAIMSILVVVRHSRAEEESGRAELVRAAVVGRHAQATAAYLTAVLTNLAVAAAGWAGLVLAGLDAYDSLALVASVAAAGLVFAAVATTTSQVTEHARGASGLALAVLGVAFLLRAIGDVQQQHGSWLSWLSPIAWSQQARPFVDARWWPLLLSLAAVVALLVVSDLLAARRDVGAGLVAARAGRAEAKPGLTGPFALAWRQQRASVVAWAVGIVVFGYSTGTFTSQIVELVDDPTLAQLLGGDAGDLADGFLAYVVLLLAIAVGAFALSSVMRIRGEESAGRAEPALAGAVSRTRWLGGQLAVTALAAVGLLALAGLSAGAGAVSSGLDGAVVGRLLGAAMLFVPAVGVLVALAAALFGLRGALTGLAWVLLGYAIVVGLFGGLLDLPTWAGNLSPFEATPAVPAAELTWGAPAILAGVAVALLVVAFAGFRRRDLTTT